MSDNPYDGVNEHDPEQDQHKDEDEREPVFTVNVPVLDISDAMTLHQLVGDGSYGEDEVVLKVTLPGYYPMIQFRGKTYMVNSQEILKAVCAMVLAAEAEGEDFQGGDDGDSD